MIIESYEDVIILSGALRHNHWETIHTAVSLTLDRYPTGVILDCSGLTECTREGAETFRSALGFIEAHDSRIIVASVPPNVMEVLKESDETRSQLPIAASVEEARASLNVLDSHVNEEDMDRSRGAKKERRETEGEILVVLTMSEMDPYLVRFAANLGETARASIRAIAPILVPRELPIQSPLPTEEKQASEALHVAELIAEELKVPLDKDLARARDFASAIEDAIRPSSLQVIVGLSPDSEALDANCKIVRSVLSRVSAPVSFVRGH